MKRVIWIAVAVIIGCMFFVQEVSAQNKKLEDNVIDLKLPSYLYTCIGSARLYDGYDVKYAYKYYINDNYHLIKEGPMKIYGSFEDYFGMTSVHTTYTANVNIIGNTANGDLNGPMSATYSEQAKGMLANESYTLTLKTTFKDDNMVGSLTMDSSLNIEGDKEKQWWHITLDSNGNPKTVDCQEDGLRLKASYNDKGEATGELVEDGNTLKFDRNVTSSVFMTKNGELRTCEAEQKAILDKYVKGTYNADDLFREGYVLRPHKYRSLDFDENALSCLNLSMSQLGKFRSICISTMVLKQLDVLKYEDLVAYVDSTKSKTAFNWKDLRYDESNKKVLMNGDWFYVQKSDFDKFEHLVDSIARLESSEFADFLLASQYAYHTYKFKGREFTPRDDARNYENLIGLGESSFKLDSLVKNQKYPKEKVYNLHGVVTYDKGQNNGLYKMSVVLAVTATDRRWWAEVAYAENLPTEWDEYRALKTKVINQHREVVSKSSTYDPKSYMIYTKLFERYDLNATEDFDQSMKVFKTLDVIRRKFLEYCRRRELLSAANNELVAKLAAYEDILPLYKTYFASLVYTWNPKKGADALQMPHKVITRTSIFLSMREKISANDEKLNELLPIAKNLSVIYEQWRQTVDLTWTPDIDCGKLQDVIDIQKACIEILSKPDIKDICKRIKKSKLTDIPSIITFVKSYEESAAAADKTKTKKK